MILQSDLDLSVENGLWATQKHNETILDQAYRTSTEVILIFGVNKSGEFYGYARYVMFIDTYIDLNTPQEWLVGYRRGSAEFRGRRTQIPHRSLFPRCLHGGK